MDFEYRMYREDNSKYNYLYFDNLYKLVRYNIDLDYLKSKSIKCSNNNYWFNCPKCNNNALSYSMKHKIFKCFSCIESGNIYKLVSILEKVDIKKIKENPLKYHFITNDLKTDDEMYKKIYDELKTNYKIKDKKLALFAIKEYKLDITFIDKSLYEESDIMNELIKNCGGSYIDFIVSGINKGVIDLKTFNIINEEHLKENNALEKLCEIDDLKFLDVFLYGISNDVLKTFIRNEKIVDKLAYVCNEIDIFNSSDEIIKKVFHVYDGVPNDINIIKNLLKISPYHFLVGGTEGKKQNKYEGTIFEQIDRDKNCQFVIKEILNNKEDIKEIVKYNDLIISYINDELKKDIDFALEIININYDSYIYFPNEIKNNDKVKDAYERKERDSELLDMFFDSEWCDEEMPF